MEISHLLHSMSGEDKVKYILITSIILYFFGAFTNADVGTIIGLVLSTIIVIYMVEEKNSDTTLFNKDMEYKLKSLYDDERIPEFISIDSNMIEFFSLISDYKEYNYSVYEKLISRTNQFLQIRTEIETGTALNGYDFEVAHDIYRNCMNYMQSFKISLPMALYENHELAEKRYQILMKRNLDIMLDHVKEAPYNVYKKSTYYYDTTRPSDSYNEDDSTPFGVY